MIAIIRDIVIGDRDTKSIGFDIGTGVLYGDGGRRKTWHRFLSPTLTPRNTQDQTESWVSVQRFERTIDDSANRYSAESAPHGGCHTCRTYTIAEPVKGLVMYP